MYACIRDTGIRVSIKRKSHNLDETLLRRAKRALGRSTETDTIHEALRAVLIGAEVVGDLKAARDHRAFRREFVREMRRERRRVG